MEGSENGDTSDSTRSAGSDLTPENFLCDICHTRESEYYVEYWTMVIYETRTNKCIQDDGPGDDAHLCHQCLINWSLGSKWNNNCQK